MGSRLKQLDVLRAIAVLYVIFVHWPGTSESMPIIVRLFRRVGWTGVDLFFVLSGFLVSGLLFREYKRYGRVDLIRFYIRRGLKIYPAFYALLAVTAVLYYFRGMLPMGHALKPLFFLSEAAFIQNYWHQIWGHTWSLAVEEHFYAMLGILTLCSLKLKSKDSFRCIVPVFLTVAVFCLAFRVFRTLDDHAIRNQWLTHLRIDSLLFGVFLSYFYNFHSDRTHHWFNSRRRIVLAASLLLLLPSIALSVEHSFIQTFGFTFLYLGYGGIMMLAVCGPEARLPRIVERTLGVLSFVGGYSYSIYLWHVAVINWGPPYFQQVTGQYPSQMWLFVICVLCSLVLGIGMAVLVESPFLRFRDRLYPSKSGVLQAMVAERTAAGSVDASAVGAGPQRRR